MAICRWQCRPRAGEGRKPAMLPAIRSRAGPHTSACLTPLPPLRGPRLPAPPQGAAIGRPPDHIWVNWPMGHAFRTCPARPCRRRLLTGIAAAGRRPSPRSGPLPAGPAHGNLPPSAFSRAFVHAEKSRRLERPNAVSRALSARLPPWHPAGRLSPPTFPAGRLFGPHRLYTVAVAPFARESQGQGMALDKRSWMLRASCRSRSPMS